MRKAGFAFAGTVNSLAQIGSPALSQSVAFLARPTDSIAVVRECLDVQRCRDTLVSAAQGLLGILRRRAEQGSGHVAAAIAVVIGDRGSSRDLFSRHRDSKEDILRRNVKGTTFETQRSSASDISSRSGSWISVAPSVASDHS
jgi:hypothetical protein